MKIHIPIPAAVVGFIVVIAAAWLAVDTLAPSPFTYFGFRNVYVQFSGTITFALFSVAMILATRPRFLERWFDGMDKIYRLHKWIGISAFVLAISHWWMAQGTKWMVAWGWLERPVRGKMSPPDTATLEGFLRSIRGNMEVVGEIAFYAAAVLLILALINRFPYRLFQRTHKWLAFCYLALAAHAFALFNFKYWTDPIGWLTALLLIGGVVSALWILFKRTGKDRQVGAQVTALNHYPSANTVEIELAVDGRWPGHQAGQFVFVTFNPQEGAHPFTVASAWNPRTHKLTLVVKELGDYTKNLHEKLRIGDRATIEGPYGCFTFDDDAKRQIWIGAGIGITPFIARMQQLAQQPGVKQIDLFHPTQSCPPEAESKLYTDAKAAGVNVHLLISPRDGLLTVDDICRAVPEWQEATIWFCGPTAFGKALKKDFLAAGMKRAAFRQEFFSFR